MTQIGLTEKQIKLIKLGLLALELHGEEFIDVGNILAKLSPQNRRF